MYCLHVMTLRNTFTWQIVFRQHKNMHSMSFFNIKTLRVIKNLTPKKDKNVNIMAVFSTTRVQNRRFIFAFSIMSLDWDGADNWNPFSWKRRTFQSYIVDTMVVDGLVTLGARASAAMILTYFLIPWLLMAQVLSAILIKKILFDL